MKKKKMLSVLLATAVAGSMVSVTAGCNVDNLEETTVYFVGDSTVCEYASTEDADLYMKRYGYGSQFAKFISGKAKVKNLAVSGRSSYSFTKEENYTTLTENIKAGDYLIVGFGHNDETSSNDDLEKIIPKYTDPTLGKDDDTSITTLIQSVESRPLSFKYVLNEYYIKLAKDKGATPVLCTPIVRLTEKADGYTGAKIHVTPDLTVGGVTYKGGDYAQAIRDLGSEMGVTVVDLTTKTLADYNPGGVNKYDEVKWRHSASGAEWANAEKTEINVEGTDQTHTNKFGAQMNAYYIAKELKDKNHPFGKYVKSDISKPVFNELDSRNPNYAIRLPGQWVASKQWGVNAPWYGTAFGATGGNSLTDYFRIEQYAEEDKFIVGGLRNDKGKIAKNAEGYAMAFYQLNKSDSFEITAEVTLDVYPGIKQTGFGLMLRDNMTIDTKLGDADSIQSDYYATGAFVDEAANAESTYLFFSRGDKTTESSDPNEEPTVERKLFTHGYNASADVDGGALTQGNTYTLKIRRIGTTVTLWFNDKYIDFTLGENVNLFKLDAENMYVCLFATRGTTATFKLTDFKVNGESKLYQAAE